MYKKHSAGLRDSDNDIQCMILASFNRSVHMHDNIFLLVHIKESINATSQNAQCKMFGGRWDASDEKSKLQVLGFFLAEILA